MVRRTVHDMWMTHNGVCHAHTNPPSSNCGARDVEPNRPFPTEAAGPQTSTRVRKKQVTKVKWARVAVERAKRLARDRAKADKAVARLCWAVFMRS
jgi:hypothetical protein